MLENVLKKIKIGKIGKFKIPSRKIKTKVGRVLIVEDDALLSKVLSQGFLAEKFEVASVANGLEVAEAVKAFSPDIIMLDLILPGLDGFEVLKRLKADDKTKNIPVVVISNLEEAGDVKSTRALGADQYFVKANTEMKAIINYAKDKIKS